MNFLNNMTLEPIAIFHSPFPEKFGIPRQAGVVADIRGTVSLEPSVRSADALRGLEGFDFIWLIWGFNLNKEGSAAAKLTVRPPRLGGNSRIGVFASRSPFRPNPLGLSSVRIERIDFDNCEIHVLGADLADGTPVYDIKPYVTYTDSHAEAASGFVDSNTWRTLEVRIPDSISAMFRENELTVLEQVLAEDPRPGYQDDPDRIFGMSYAGREIRFRVKDGILEVME